MKLFRSVLVFASHLISTFFHLQNMLAWTISDMLTVSLLQFGFPKKQPLKSEISLQELYREMLSGSLPEWEGKETRLDRGKNKSLSQPHRELQTGMALWSCYIWRKGGSQPLHYSVIPLIAWGLAP